MKFLLLIFIGQFSNDAEFPAITYGSSYLSFQNAINVTEKNNTLFICGFGHYNWGHEAIWFKYKKTENPWSPAITVVAPGQGPSSTINEHPTMLVNNNGIVYMFWHTNVEYDFSIYYARSNNYNEFVFPAIPNIFHFLIPDENLEIYNELFPSATLDAQDNMHLVFQSDYTGTYDIYYAKFVLPSSWNIENISGTISDSYFPMILARGNDLVVFWSEYLDGGPPFIYIRQFKNGKWESAKKLSPSPGPNCTELSGIIDNSGNLLLFYKQDEALYSLTYNLENNSILRIQKLWDAPPSVFGPKASMDSSGTVHLFFSAGGQEERDIYYTYTSQSDTFLIPAQRLTFAQNSSERPHGFYNVNDGKLHVFWVDYRPVNAISKARIFTKYKEIGQIFSYNTPPAHLTVIWHSGTALNLPFKTGKNARIKIFNILGDQINRLEYEPQNEVFLKIEIPRGIYFFKLKDGNKFIEGKIIKL